MSNWAERASASLLPLSRASTLGAALKEWTYTGRFFDLEAADGTCELCGQQELRYHFEIENGDTSASLLVGSECIKRFEIAGIDEQCQRLVTVTGHHQLVEAFGAVQRLGVGVEQQLVGVEAVAVLGIVRAVDAVAVDLSRAGVGQITVPDLIGTGRQQDARNFARRVGVEQAQFNRRGMRRKQRKVDAAAVPARTKRKRPPVFEPRGS